MKTYVLDADHNITAYASQQQASSAVPPGDAFTTAAGLKAALKNYPAATTVGIWNSLTGVAPVKRFKDAATAAERIFAELQKLGVPDAETAPANTDAPKAKRAPKGDAKPVAARKATKKVAKHSANEPRSTSKTAQLIEMLKQPKGATLEEVMAEFGWQVHTTRAIMSAGRNRPLPFDQSRRPLKKGTRLFLRWRGNAEADWKRRIALSTVSSLTMAGMQRPSRVRLAQNPPGHRGMFQLHFGTGPPTSNAKNGMRWVGC